MPQPRWILAPFVALACALSATPATAAKPPEKGYVFGVGQPVAGPAGERGTALVTALLSKAIGAPVTARTFKTYDGLTDALAKGEVDLAWVGPVVFTRAASRAPVKIVRQALDGGLPSYRSVLFVRAASGLATLRELKGKRMAWVQKGSASGNTFARAILLKNKLDPDKLFDVQLFLQDHAAVCSAVRAGTVDVGASFTHDRLDLDPRRVDSCVSEGAKPEDFTIIATSPPIPNDVLATRAGFDPAVAERLGTALDELLKTPDGKRALTEGFRCDGLTVGRLDAFEFVRDVLDFVAEE